MKMSKAIQACLPYKVVRDSREKEGHGWQFRPGPHCGGTVVGTLKTGDYSVKGFEEFVTIERKESIEEFVGSLVSPRFRGEMERMRDIPQSFVLLQFGVSALLRWPHNTRVPRDLPLSKPGALMSVFAEYIFTYDHVRFLFVEDEGHAVASAILKKAVEKYAARRNSA